MTPRTPLSQQLHRFPAQPEWVGKRLKEALRACVPALSSRDALLVIRNGLVRVGADERIVDDADFLLSEGQGISVDLRHGVHGKGKSKHPPIMNRVRVVHEDEHIVVVSKAAGVKVQPVDAEDEEKDDGTPPLIELLKHYWRAKDVEMDNPILVQRLDRDTSGLMVLAKTKAAAGDLQRQLKPPRGMKRIYLAIVAGEMRLDKGKWSTMQGRGPVGLRQSVSDVGKRAISDPDAKEATTNFSVVEILDGATLLELALETGRTHQIRIHCAESGHPVLGDVLYTKLGEYVFRRQGEAEKAPALLNPSRELVKQIEAGVTALKQPKRECPRMALHAWKLSFTHPETKKKMSFEEPFPKVLEEYRRSLKKS